MQAYEDDVLEIFEDYVNLPASFLDESEFGDYGDSTAEDAATVRAQPPTTSKDLQPEIEKRNSSRKRTAPYMRPSLKGIPVPAIINGAKETSLDILLPSSTIQEVKMRINNDVQKFTTLEGEVLFIPKQVLQRLNLEKIQTMKRDFIVNLPDKFQVRLNIKKDGRVIFHHHHKRGIHKLIQRVVEQSVQRAGECTSKDESQTKPLY